MEIVKLSKDWECFKAGDIIVIATNMFNSLRRDHIGTILMTIPNIHHPLGLLSNDVIKSIIKYADCEMMQLLKLKKFILSLPSGEVAQTEQQPKRDLKDLRILKRVHVEETIDNFEGRLAKMQKELEDIQSQRSRLAEWRQYNQK